MQKPTYLDEPERAIDNLDYSLRRFFVDRFYFRHAANIPAYSKILDLGGHKIAKRGKFNINNYNFNVVYINLTVDKRPDIQADAAHVPLKSNTFDVVICAELLEHVMNPLIILQEAHRLLRSGGMLLLCAPFLYRIHGDPHDFGRYTDHYWNMALEEAGFQKIQIERQGSFFVMLFDFFKQYATEARWHKYRRYRPLVQALLWGQRWALNIEQKPSIQQHQFLRSFTTGFGIQAYK